LPAGIGATRCNKMLSRFNYEVFRAASRSLTATRFGVVNLMLVITHHDHDEYAVVAKARCFTKRLMAARYVE
jgi:hypothetical protein